jgi:hypothetical protein
MLIRSVLYLFCLCFITAAYTQGKIEEITVLENAQEENLPIVAVFLNSDCPWSKKLHQEILGSRQFLEKINPEAILWMIDLQGKEEDKIFLQKYHVQRCPLFLLLDPKGKEFARFEYVPMDGAGYGEIIIEQIENFQEICTALDRNDHHFEEEKWQELYQKAKKLSAPCFQQVILERGVRAEKGTYFHLEKFATLLEKNKLKNAQVLKAKQRLLARDPENALGTHFKVAVLEFQKIASRHKPKDRPEKAIMPLLRYIHKFRKKDCENFWKSEWMIAEFLFTKNFIDIALEHAETAYSASPETIKPQIAEMISFMKGKLTIDCLPGSDPDQIFGDLE